MLIRKLALGSIAAGVNGAAESIGTLPTAMATANTALGTEADAGGAVIAGGIEGGIADAEESLAALPAAAAEDGTAAGTALAEGIEAGVAKADDSIATLPTATDGLALEFGAAGDAAGDELAGGIAAGVADAEASLEGLATSVTGIGTSFSSVLMGAMAIGGGVMGLDALTGHAAATAESIAQVGAATGLTATQSTQLLAAFSAVGDNAQTANQMIQMLDKNLTSMSTTTIEQMKEFGVAVTNASGNALPLPDILNNVSAAYQSLGAQKGTEMLETIFGRSAITLAPLIANWQQISSLVSGIQAPFGDDTATQAYIADLEKMHIDMFQVSLDIAKIGADITPAMEKVAKGLEDVLGDLTGGKGIIQAFEDWSKDIGAVGTAFTGLGIAVGIIEGITIATKLATDAQTALAGVMLGINWAAFGIEMTAIGIAEGAATIATWLWAAAQTALDFVLSPMGIAIGLVVIALAALAVGVYEVIEHWSQIRAFFENIWTDIKTDATAIWTEFKTWLHTNWTAIKEDANTIWTAVKDFFPDLWTDIETDAENAWGDIKSFFETFWSDEKAGWSDLGQTIESLLSTAWNDIVSTAITAWDDLESTIAGVWTTIESDIDTAYNDIVGIINKIVGAIDSAISAMKSLLGMSGGGSTTGAQGSVNIAMANNAVGGIATQATAGIFGEAGDEALIPLDDPQAMSMLGGAFGGGGAYFGGNGGGGQTVINNIYCSNNVTQSEENLANIICQRIMEKISLLGGNYDPTWATGR